jgi:hypothetical protein
MAWLSLEAALKCESLGLFSHDAYLNRNRIQGQPCHRHSRYLILGTNNIRRLCIHNAFLLSLRSIVQSQERFVRFEIALMLLAKMWIIFVHGFTLVFE